MQDNPTYPPLVDPAEIFDLDGRVVAIFGGAGKMGQAFAEVLSNARATVYLFDLADERAEEAARSIGARSKGRVVGMGCDVADEADIKRAFERISEDQGRLDVLIYNVYAKPDGYYRPFEEYPVETWERAVTANVTGAFLCCRAAVATFRELGVAGNIILTLSTYGLVSPDPRIYEGLDSSTNIYGGGDSLNTPMAYTVSKSGLLGMVKWLAGTYGRYGIRANALTPGGVLDGQEDRFQQAYTYRVPLGRMANWTDYNGAILYLASDASRYMTGANLVVDGGWTAW